MQSVTAHIRMPSARRMVPLAGLALACGPLLYLVVQGLGDRLGANPIEEITHVTGEWTLRMLLLSLAVTPVRRLLGFTAVTPLRRTFGLAAFFYGSLHALTYIGLDQGFDWAFIVEDVSEHRYVLVGFAAWCCLLPLALTSNRRSMRKLGRKWQTLHRLAYLAVTLGCLHYLWLVKADLLPPLLTATALALLLGARFLRRPRASC
jgi:sulfoxide reductase heme-binding subunit YedZ